jgi:hypothetical protein
MVKTTAPAPSPLERRTAPEKKRSTLSGLDHSGFTSLNVSKSLREHASPFAVLRTPLQTNSGRRGSSSQRVLTVQYLQRAVGNRCLDRALHQPSRKIEGAQIQRDSLNPLDWASDLLHRLTGDADRDEADVQNDATQRSTQLQNQSATSSSDLQSKSETQGTALGTEATTQGTSVETQSEAQGRGLQGQADANASQLTSQSSTSGAEIQQEAGGKSKQLQADLGALDTQTRSNVNDATGTLGADVKAVHGEGDAADGQIKDQWNVLETQGSTHVKAATTQTEALVHGKTALIQEYQGSGEHNPEQFQKRWSELQGQVTVAERGESSLQQTEDAGQSVNARAPGIWSKITNRGQALVVGIGNLASRAWNTLQTSWSSLQSTAAKALADVRQQASAAVARVRNLATAAWTKLQSLANQAWPALRDMATRAWSALKSRGTAAWLALQAAAAAAWMALQTAANSIVTSLASKISGIIGRLNGAVGRIVQFLASAVSSLISRVRSVTGRALDFVSSTFARVGETLRGIGARAWQGLKDVAERAWSGLKDIGTRSWTALKDLGARVWTGLKDLGTRIWNGLQSLAKRAWDMLSKGWEWLKRKAEAAWKWVKKAWEALKSAARSAWDWIKRKARAALEWLKRKWAWLKAMISRAIAWLKAKWKWLKSILGVLQVLRARMQRLWNQLVAKLRQVIPVPSSPRELVNFLAKVRDIAKAFLGKSSPAMAAAAASAGGKGSPLTTQFGAPTEDYGTDNKGGAGGCGLCYDAPGPANAGTAAHRIIQLEFTGQLLAQGLRPETEFVLGGVTPDLAFWRGNNRLEIGEIKPDNPQGIEAGTAKLTTAIPAAKLKYPTKIVAPLGVPLVGGMVMPTLSPTPGCQVQDLFVKPPSAGLYLYFCEPTYKQLKARGCQCKADLPPVPVTKKETEKEKGKSWFQKFKEQLAAHPVAAAVLVAALIALIVALVVLFLPIPEPISKAISAILAVLSGLTAAAVVVGLFLSMPNEGGSAPVA